jgi:hypothetical protein
MIERRGVSYDVGRSHCKKRNGCSRIMKERIPASSQETRKGINHIAVDMALHLRAFCFASAATNSPYFRPHPGRASSVLSKVHRCGDGTRCGVLRPTNEKQQKSPSAQPDAGCLRAKLGFRCRAEADMLRRTKMARVGSDLPRVA